MTRTSFQKHMQESAIDSAESKDDDQDARIEAALWSIAEQLAVANMGPEERKAFDLDRIYKKDTI